MAHDLRSQRHARACRHPRLAFVRPAKSWMPAFAGMTEATIVRTVRRSGYPASSPKLVAGLERKLARGDKALFSNKGFRRFLSRGVSSLCRCGYLRRNGLGVADREPASGRRHQHLGAATPRTAFQSRSFLLCRYLRPLAGVVRSACGTNGMGQRLTVCWSWLAGFDVTKRAGLWLYRDPKSGWVLPFDHRTPIAGAVAMCATCVSVPRGKCCGGAR